ncbi:MAG: hypothetical protein BWY63_03692 [Chloroflexi bacterium ADurb.Bin360]|nr:MAG: hypothetical protein BWY63_03692 [Chloroflexi bacterium ADurb.Bin360]
MRTDLGNVQKLCLALGIRFHSRETERLNSMSLRKTDQCAGSDAHGFELLLSRVGFGVVEVIQRRQLHIYPRLEIQ